MEFSTAGWMWKKHLDTLTFCEPIYISLSFFLFFNYTFTSDSLSTGFLQGATCVLV
jgi:hypothetical protein